MAPSGAGKSAARWMKEWTDPSSSSVQRGISIKLRESVQPLMLIAKATMKMKWKCPVYISDLSSASVDFLQLFALRIQPLLPFNHF